MSLHSNSDVVPDQELPIARELSRIDQATELLAEDLIKLKHQLEVVLTSRPENIREGVSAQEPQEVASPMAYRLRELRGTIQRCQALVNEITDNLEL